jgi:hypothetical protein
VGLAAICSVGQFASENPEGYERWMESFEQKEEPRGPPMAPLFKAQQAWGIVSPVFEGAWSGD